jgi:hypothetical protein
MRASLKKFWTTAARAGVSAGLLVWLALTIKWQELAVLVGRADAPWIVAAVGLIVLSMAVSVAKWRLVLAAQGMHVGLSSLWDAYWAGLFFNNFLPSSIGGDAYRAYRIGGVASDTPGAATSVVLERIIATCGLSIVGLMGAACIRDPQRTALILFAALAFVSAALTVALMRIRPSARFAARTGRIATFLTGVLSHGTRLTGSKGLLAGVLALSVVFQVCVVAVNMAVFRTLRVSGIGWGEAFFLIPFTSVAAMLPVGINGFGLREGAYVAMLGRYGVAREAALASSLLYAVLVSLSSLYGGLILLTHRRRSAMDDRSRIVSAAEAQMRSCGNCCQAVLMAAGNTWGFDVGGDLAASTSLFAKGMGSGCACGALVGMVMAAGVLQARRGPHTRGDSLERVLHDRFREEFGATCCRAIRARRSGLDRLGNRSCVALTGRAAGILFDVWEGRDDDGASADVTDHSDPERGRSDRRDAGDPPGGIPVGADRGQRRQ